MKNLFTALFLSLVAQLAFAAPVNLVQNGDFETPVAGPGIVPGWLYAGGESYYGVDPDYSAAPQARPGLVFYEGAAVNPGYLSQNIATTAGTAYRLEFDLQRYGASGSPASNVTAFTFGALAAFSQTNTAGDWTHYIIDGLVAGPGAFTLLEFSSANVFDFTQLDNVSVTALDAVIAIPEPGTGFILGAAIGALVLARRRRAG